MGGRDEKNAATAMLVAALTSPLVQQQSFVQVDLRLVAIDILLLIVLTGIAMKSNRYWPIFATGFMLNGTLVHLFPGFFAWVTPDAYADMAVVWAYPVQLSLLAGTMLEAGGKLAKP
ncbi:hypothetical protein [Thermaurantiacus sp.]